jgi:hypothetical protein
MVTQKELVSLLGTAGLGVLASLGVEAYVDGKTGFTVESIGPFKEPSSWLDLAAGAVMSILGYTGYKGKGPVKDTVAQNILMGLGAGAIFGGAAATIRPKIAPEISPAKVKEIRDNLMIALKGEADVVLPDSVIEKYSIGTLGLASAPAAISVPLTKEEARFAKIYGY